VSRDTKFLTTTYVLEMTSQRWRSAEEVNRPVWTHLLTIVWPNFGSMAQTALLIVGGGVNDDVKGIALPDTLADEELLAFGTGSVIAHVTTVPNQPLLFADQSDPLESEALLVYTGDKFLRGQSAAWRWMRCRRLWPATRAGM